EKGADAVRDQQAGGGQKDRLRKRHTLRAATQAALQHVPLFAGFESDLNEEFPRRALVPAQRNELVFLVGQPVVAAAGLGEQRHDCLGRVPRQVEPAQRWIVITAVLVRRHRGSVEEGQNPLVGNV